MSYSPRGRGLGRPPPLPRAGPAAGEHGSVPASRCTDQEGTHRAVPERPSRRSRTGRSAAGRAPRARPRTAVRARPERPSDPTGSADPCRSGRTRPTEKCSGGGGGKLTLVSASSRSSGTASPARSARAAAPISLCDVRPKSTSSNCTSSDRRRAPWRVTERVASHPVDRRLPQPPREPGDLADRIGDVTPAEIRARHTRSTIVATEPAAWVAGVEAREHERRVEDNRAQAARMAHRVGLGVRGA